jgi:hypothetical protein
MAPERTLPAELAEAARCRGRADEAHECARVREAAFVESVADAARLYDHGFIAVALGISRERIAELCYAALGVEGLTRLSERYRERRDPGTVGVLPT